MKTQQLLSLVLLTFFFGWQLQANPVYNGNPHSVYKNSVSNPLSSISNPNYTLPAGNDRLLMVGVVNFANQQNVNATFGSGSSNAMTLVKSVDFGAAQLSVFAMVLGSGPEITGDIVASGTGGAYFTTMLAYSFSNIDQTKPFDGISSNTSTGTSSSLTVSSAINDMVCDFTAVNSGNAKSYISAQIEQAIVMVENGGNHNNGQQYIDLGSSLKQGASSVDMDWTFPSSFDFAQIAFNLNYATLGPVSLYNNNGSTSAKNSVATPDDRITLANFTIPAGEDRLLAVAAVNFRNTQTPAATFGTGSNNAMTLVESIDFGAAQLSIFILPMGSGDAVTGDIVATAGNAAYFSTIGAQTFEHINQVTPVDGVTSNTANTTYMFQQVTSQIGDLVCDFIAVNTGSSTASIGADANQRITYIDNTGNHNNGQQYISLGSSLRKGAPNVNMTWKTPSSFDIAHVALNLNSEPFGGYELYDNNEASAAKNSVVTPDDRLTLANFTVPAGENRVLTVAAVNFRNTQTATATFGTGSDNAMTLVKSVDFGAAQLSVFVKTLGSGNAITGDIVATAGNQAFFSSLGAQSFHGIDQNTPYDNLTNNTTTASLASLTITSENNDLACDFIAVNSGASSTDITAANHQQATFNDNTGNHNNGQQYISLASSMARGAALVDMDWSYTASYEFAHVGFNLNRAPETNKPVTLPISVTGFNEDVIAEGTGGDASAVTSVTFDDPGVTGSDHVMYSKEFRYGTTGGQFGLPNDGKIISITDEDITYQLASYTQNNVLLLTGDQSGELALAKASAFDRLTILSASAQGASTFTVTVTYSDNTTQEKSFTVADWFNGANPAIQGMGRITRTGDSYDDNTGNPRLYDSELDVDETKVVTKLSFKKQNSTSRTGIFAICGLTAAGVPITPVATEATNVEAKVGFTANWNAVAGADGYYIDIAKDESFTDMVSTYTNKEVGNATSLVVGVPSGVYYYRVRAYNLAGQSLSSNTIKVDIMVSASN
ncbi:MAG: hypothetical protein KDC92_07735, partial [Bacteroidetes bacterium]|nr:hypothetical protein [Bacteroidota bacterium]